MKNKFMPIGLGKKKKLRKGRGIIDSIKKGVKKLQSLGLAQKGLDAIQDNKIIRDTLEKTKLLRPLSQALVKSRQYGFGKKGKGGFFTDAYNFGKKSVGKILDVNNNLKKLGIARNLNKILPYAQTIGAMVPKYGPAISAGLMTAQKPIQKLSDMGYGKRGKGFVMKNPTLKGMMKNNLHQMGKINPIAHEMNTIYDTIIPRK